MAGAIFWNSHNAEFRLGADSIQPEVRYTDGRIKTPAASIKFNNHMFRCEDGPVGAKQATVIRDCTEFKIGRVREVSDEELQRLVAQQAQQVGVPVGMIKPTQGDEVGYMPEDKHKVVSN